MTVTLTSLSKHFADVSMGAIRYSVALINTRLNFRKFVEVNADTAVEAVKKAKSWNDGYDLCESCIPVKVNY